jgi:transposase
MKRQERIRAVIVHGLAAGMTANDISQAHKLSKSTVYHVKSRLEAFVAAGGYPENFSIDRKKPKRRSDCKLAVIADDVYKIVKRDPGKSMRAIAKELNVDESTIRRTVKGDSRFRSYARRRTQFLSEVMTKSRAKKLDRSSVEKAKKLDKSSVACRRSRTRI